MVTWACFASLSVAKGPTCLALHRRKADALAPAASRDVLARAGVCATHCAAADAHSLASPRPRFAASTFSSPRIDHLTVVFVLPAARHP